MIKKLLLVLMIITVSSIGMGCENNSAIAVGNSSTTSEVTSTNEMISENNLSPQKLIKSEIPLKIISMTNPIWPGDEIQITIQTSPNVYCKGIIYTEYHEVYDSYSSLSGNHRYSVNKYKIDKYCISDEQGIGVIVFPMSDDMVGYYRLDIQIGTHALWDKQPIDIVAAKYYLEKEGKIIIPNIQSELITSIFVN